MNIILSFNDICILKKKKKFTNKVLVYEVLYERVKTKINANLFQIL